MSPTPKLHVSPSITDRTSTRVAVDRAVGIIGGLWLVFDLDGNCVEAHGEARLLDTATRAAMRDAARADWLRRRPGR